MAKDGRGHADRAASVSGSHGFLQALRGIGQELDRGESISDRAMHGASHGGFSRKA
jgi:hypothetical protein